ncbi:SH3 domain-containing YSC84-like protein 1 isoform X1 [Alexandromys fortis]|uniref:SH3 domain-containing YSC84-like protein 1 isoform X1 n=1 Tax=Alexandromys fortis TaxID=100897 RepID=UPI0021534F2F|nr:SH3 domain-containing YSC84-like protein 1 isoform X1 [Microtus fortis]
MPCPALCLSSEQVLWLRNENLIVCLTLELSGFSGYSDPDCDVKVRRYCGHSAGPLTGCPYPCSVVVTAKRKLNNPIPSNLKSEAKKAAKILREFTEITSRNGPDKIIPAHVIAKAKGLAVLSVIKAGFLVTARGGSGIVLARLPDGKWSAPSAIGIAGLGGGFEIGIEVSDLVIILNYDRAVEAFAKGGNLTLGGNFTVAVGPLGRNLEGNVALRSSAAVFTYCKSRGLFAGISLEGSCLIERKETNRKFYCQDIRAYDILFGDVPQPAQAEDLYEILNSFTEKYENEGQRINLRKAAREHKKAKELPPKPSSRPQQSLAPVQPNGPQSNGNEYKLYPELSSYREKTGNLNQPIEVTALYSFEGQQPGDLNFQAGDRITVISKTDSHFDWWEGKLRGQTGIFPANYVTMN